MLWGITLALLMAVTLGFKAMSWRFDRTASKRKLPPPESFPLVSVVIPAYKSEKSIGRALESVRKSDYPSKEIIVVNDSDDRTPAIARQYGARVVQNKRRRGKAAALNQAARHAGGEFLLVLDSDTVLRKKTLSTLVRSHMAYEEAGERVGITAPRYAASNRKNIIARLSDTEQRLHQSLMKMQMNMGSILSIRGSCMLVSRAAFDEAGGFSQTLLEDGDFTAKAIKAGYSIKYEPRAMARIREPETLSSLLKAKQRYGKGTFYCALRHYRPYVLSLQAAVCFFPQFLLMLAAVGTLMFHNPLTLAPISLLMASLTLSGAWSYIFIALVTAVSVVTAGNQLAAAQAGGSGLLGTTLPFALFFIPLVTIAYARGAASGIADKLGHRPELEFSQW